MSMQILRECCPLCRLHRALHSGRGENYLTEHGKSCKIVYVEICAVNINELRGYPAHEAVHSLRPDAYPIVSPRRKDLIYDFIGRYQE